MLIIGRWVQVRMVNCVLGVLHGPSGKNYECGLLTPRRLSGAGREKLGTSRAFLYEEIVGKSASRGFHLPVAQCHIHKDTSEV